MLGSPLVALQAEFAVGDDGQALCTEALPAVDVLVAAPWAMHDGMLGCGLVLAIRHALHDILETGQVVAMADEDGVVHCHDDYFLDADHGSQRSIGADVGIADMVELDRSLGDIAGTVGLADIEKGIPGPQIGPTEPGRHHPAFVGSFHHRIVNRLGRCLAEGLGIEEHG